MKILYCIPTLYNSGGMERVLTEKANYLVGLGYDITIVSIEDSGREPFFVLDKKIKHIDLAIDFEKDYEKSFIIKVFRYKHKLNLLKRQIEFILNAESYDFAISLCGKEINFWSKLNTSAKKLAEIHFAHDFKEQFIKARRSGLFWNIFGKILTIQFIKKTQKLDALVVLTKEDKSHWLKTNNNVYQIYNPSSISTDCYPSLDGTHFIAVGRLDKQKGFDVLIDIWAKVYKQNPKLTLDIFGTGPLYCELHNQILRLGLQSVIKLRGATSNITQEYLKSTALIMTSRYEGFPLVLIEAQSCGLPTIALNCHYGPSEIINDKKNGYLVPLFEFDTMVKHIIELSKNKGLRLKLSKEAKENSLNYLPEKIISQWDTLFKNMSKSL